MEATSALQDEVARDVQQQIAEVFDRFDTDGDGTIDRKELALLLQKSNQEAWTDERIDMLLEQVDTNGNHRIDYEEFLAWVFSDKTGQRTLQGLTEAPDPSLAPYDGPRWMLHDRKSEDYPRTALRSHPVDTKDYKLHAAINGEVVEVLGSSGKYFNVRLALTRTTGWLHERHLHPCAEAAPDVPLLGSSRQELKPSDGRLKDVRKFLRRRNSTRRGGDIRASRVWFLKGHHLGHVGLESGRPKETVFFGCQNALVEPIATGGFAEVFADLRGDFGKGAHVSPQSCKAYKACENYMFICEVAPGNDEERWTLQAPYPELDFQEVCEVQGKLSTQVHAGGRFDHEERVVYHPGQIKPVYLLELETPGLSFLRSNSPYADLLKR